MASACSNKSHQKTKAFAAHQIPRSPRPGLLSEEQYQRPAEGLPYHLLLYVSAAIMSKPCKTPKDVGKEIEKHQFWLLPTSTSPDPPLERLIRYVSHIMSRVVGISKGKTEPYHFTCAPDEIPYLRERLDKRKKKEAAYALAQSQTKRKQQQTAGSVKRTKKSAKSQRYSPIARTHAPSTPSAAGSSRSTVPAPFNPTPASTSYLPVIETQLPYVSASSFSQAPFNLLFNNASGSAAINQLQYPLLPALPLVAERYSQISYPVVDFYELGPMGTSSFSSELDSAVFGGLPDGTGNHLTTCPSLPLNLLPPSYVPTTHFTTSVPEMSPQYCLEFTNLAWPELNLSDEETRSLSSTPALTDSSGSSPRSNVWMSTPIQEEAPSFPENLTYLNNFQPIAPPTDVPAWYWADNVAENHNGPVFY